MAQTGYTPIALYYSSTASATPTAGNLVNGELALNNNDGKLFYKDSSGVVQVIGTKGGVGSSTTTQVLYNSSGLVVGSANLTFNGTTLTTANDASISGLTVGKGGGAVSNTTVVGSGAMAATNTGNYNSAFGQVALANNTSGFYNTALGRAALNANTTATDNTAVGFNGMVSNTTGGSNTAVGSQALQANTTASNNTAVGYQAGYSQTTGGAGGGYNTFIGQTAGYSATGYNNTFIGQGTGYNTTGNNNTFIGMANTGYSSGALVTTGSSNTILGGFNGNQGGLDIRTSSNYIVLSDGAGNPRGVFDGGGNLFVGATSSSFSSPRIYAQTTLNGVVGYTTSTLGYTASAYRIDNTAAYFSLFYYNTWATSVGSINTNGTTTSYNITSDRRLKENITSFTNGLEVISALKPSQYNYISDKNTVYQGFIADELQAVVPHAVTGEVNAVNEEGKPIYQGVDASFLIPHLVSAIQELNAKVTALEAQLGAK